MSMVCGLDLHRGQITFDALAVRDRRGMAGPGLAAGPAAVPPLAEPRPGRRGERRAGGGGGGGLHRVAVRGRGDHRRRLRGASGRAGRHPGARGRKHHAKTDRSDARLLRELLARRAICPSPGSRPRAVLEWRERVRLYKALVDQRTQWVQRIHAELYQHGVAVPEGQIRSEQTRAALTDAALGLSPAARQRIADRLPHDRRHRRSAEPLQAELTRFGKRQPACRALVAAHYGIGGLTAVAVWSELGDCRRFRRSMQVVRHTGFDVTVDHSDRRRASGLPLSPRPRDPALGALRGGKISPAAEQPRPRLLRRGQGRPRRQAGHHLDGPQAGPALLPHPARPRSRGRLRHALSRRPLAGTTVGTARHIHQGLAVDSS